MACFYMFMLALLAIERGNTVSISLKRKQQADYEIWIQEHSQRIGNNPKVGILTTINDDNHAAINNENLFLTNAKSKRSLNGNEEKNPTAKAPNTSHVNGTESTPQDDTVHHSMHVASWNFQYVQGPFIISVFLIAAGIAKLGFHHANFLSSKVPESCLLIILGTAVGAILYAVLERDVEGNSEIPAMTSELFFLYLLPPIILESAFSLHDRTFYDNVGTVMIYAVLGTVLNCFLIGPSLFGIYKLGLMGEHMPHMNIVQCLVFSAIVVAVDPVAVLAIFQEIGVNNTLYFMVFGESLFNDAVTVVLYNMMKTLNKMDDITFDQILIGVLQFFVVSLGGLFIGIIFGCLTAILTKYTEHCRVVEPLAVFVFAYISYLMAEMFHFSGIISIIGCGLMQAQYAFHNISRKSYTTVKYFSKMMSSTCDCVIFMFLGISLFQADVLNKDHWNLGFILWTILFCLLYRFLVVFFLTFIINRLNRLRKIDIEEQFIMAYGGLRGAVAFSLAGVLKNKYLPKYHFMTTTLVVIFFTVFIQGATIKPLVKLLRVKMEGVKKQLLVEEINSHVSDHLMAGIEEITGQRGEHYFREYLEHYNRKYLKVWLQREPASFDEQIMTYFQKLALEQHFQHLAGNKMILERYGSDTDITEDIDLDEEEEEDTERDVESIGEDIIINVPSTNASTEDINSELDREFLAAQVQPSRRRKSLFPVALTPDMETRLNENPTAQDVRKIMMPSRRQLQFKRLDKNLKSDNSENDLLSYLQNKQMRTRRVSMAVWNQPIPEASEIEENMATRYRRKSVAPTTMTNNYRRRLSLAVPNVQPEQGRKRGASVGNVLKGLESPERRRLRFKKKGVSFGLSDDRADETNLIPLATEIIHEEDERANGVNFALDSPTEEKPERPSSEKVKESPPKSRLYLRGERRDGKLRRARTLSEPESFVEKRDSFKGRSKALEQDVSKTKDNSPRSVRFADKPDRQAKFVSPKHSPSARRKQLMGLHTKSLDLPSGDRHSYVRPIEGEITPGGRIRKNPSYNKALSDSVFEFEEKS